jgi:hypothetical protein
VLSLCTGQETGGHLAGLSDAIVVALQSDDRPDRLSLWHSTVLTHRH